MFFALRWSRSACARSQSWAWWACRFSRHFRLAAVATDITHRRSISMLRRVEYFCKALTVLHDWKRLAATSVLTLAAWSVLSAPLTMFLFLFCRYRRSGQYSSWA